MKAMHHILKAVLFSIVLIKSSESIKILVVAPIYSFSHTGPIVELAKALANRNHDVTLISNQQPKIQTTNLRYIKVSLPEVGGSDDVSLFDFLSQPTFKYFNMLTELGTNCTEGLFENKNMQELLSNPKEKFDLVIYEQFFTYALQGFCHHFQAHCIIYSSLRYNSFIKPLVGFIPPLSYIPDLLLTTSNKSMTFYDRLYNLVLFIYSQYKTSYDVLPRHNKILQNSFKEVPEIKDIIYNISVVLQNSHISINPPAPEPPNVIEIGGFHLNSEETASKEIKEFLDSSTEGVIFFSFGSVLKSHQLTSNTKKALMSAFSKTKLKVLWKFENDNIEGKPDNLKIVKWAPQKYILGHPNVKLFISHGGLFSTIEAVYFGKPVMGIPVYGDQLSNMKHLENIGVARYIRFDQISENGVMECLQDVLKNTSYAIKAQENSRLMHDQPMKPMDKAIYWIEYVHRHGGGSRLALDGAKLPLYQLALLDVVFFLVCVAIALILLFITSIKSIFQKLKPKEVKTKVH